MFLVYIQLKVPFNSVWKNADVFDLSLSVSFTAVNPLSHSAEVVLLAVTSFLRVSPFSVPCKSVNSSFACLGDSPRSLASLSTQVTWQTFFKEFEIFSLTSDIHTLKGHIAG